MRQRTYIYLTGFFWFLMGAWLMIKGLKFVSSGHFNSTGIAMLISAGLFVGFLKGKFVLSKSASRVIARISSLPLPISLRKLYAPSYWILIGSMMVFGMLLSILPIPIELRGAIDIAIGAALIRGSFVYLWYGEPLSISNAR